MAEREGPRRLTQHQLEVAEPADVTATSEVRPDPAPPSLPEAEDAPVRREPSEVKLRERRRRWLEERERFERFRESGAASSSSK